MLIWLSDLALRRAKATRSRRWLRVFDVLRALDLALAGLPDTRRT